MYNLEEDLGEQTDLKKDYPEKYQELLTEWVTYTREIRWHPLLE